MDGDWTWVRLSIGAFLTSPGAGILGLVGAALLTLVGVDRRLHGEAELARSARAAEQAQDREADARERWAQMYTFLWENRDDVGGRAVLSGIGALADLATTDTQIAMLEVLTVAVLHQAEEA